MTRSVLTGLAVVAITASSAAAQGNSASEEKAVLAVVQRMFDAMKTKDTATLNGRGHRRYASAAHSPRCGQSTISTLARRRVTAESTRCNS